MMVFLYDDVGSPVGFLYRTSAYARNEYDAYFYEKNFFGDVTAIYNESGKIGYGFDAYNEIYCDMMAAGIVDPTKVTRSALQNAASIASVILTTESVVADKKEETPAPAAPAGGMGMGGGMY